MPDEKITTAKSLATSVPAAGERLFLRVSSFMPLNVLDTSEALVAVLAG